MSYSLGLSNCIIELICPKNVPVMLEMSQIDSISSKMIDFSQNYVGETGKFSAMAWVCLSIARKLSGHY